MHLATTTLRRFAEASQRANLFVLLLFFGVLLLFWNVSRPKREGFVDPQFRLLSVGSIWLDPNIVIYANEGAGTSGTI